MYNNFSMHFKTLPSTKSKAKSLRSNLTPAEFRFWNYVRSKKMAGFKFRRQHPLGNFIADFYCHRLRLVVEIDGNIHERQDNKEYDKERESQIKRLGLSVIRFTNADVLYNPAFVELTLLEFVEERRRAI